MSYGSNISFTVIDKVNTSIHHLMLQRKASDNLDVRFLVEHDQIKNKCNNGQCIHHDRFQIDIFTKQSLLQGASFYSGNDDLFLESPLTAIVKIHHLISDLLYMKHTCRKGTNQISGTVKLCNPNVRLSIFMGWGGRIHSSHFRACTHSLSIVNLQFCRGDSQLTFQGMHALSIVNRQSCYHKACKAPLSLCRTRVRDRIGIYSQNSIYSKRIIMTH